MTNHCFPRTAMTVEIPIEKKQLEEGLVSGPVPQEVEFSKG